MKHKTPRVARNAGHSDEVIVARAIENGWEMVDEDPRWGGTVRWQGWKRDGLGIPFREAPATYPGPRWVRGADGEQYKIDGPYSRTPADAMRNRLDHDDRCAECGKWVEYEDSGSDALYAPPARFCWSCNFWLERIDRIGKDTVPGYSMRPNTRPVVAAWTGGRGDRRPAYLGVGTATRPSEHNGFGGQWYVITPNNGDPEFETCDLWYGGQIPERFHDRLPITATIRYGRLVVP